MLRIYAIPALESNYFWLLHAQADRAWIIDPGDAAPVLDMLRRKNLQLMGIIITHHHWDHTDGINELLEHYPVPVYGPDSDRIPEITHPLYEGDLLELDDFSLSVIATPGHTLDHIAYLYEPARQITPSTHQNILFCGDALFAAGCGRLMEGTPEQMWQSLEKLARLPADTVFYCGHEYTLANLHFARQIEPDNPDIVRRLQQDSKKYQDQGSTLPSTIDNERRTNPFLRCHLASIKHRAENYCGHPLPDPASVFATLRAWKDQG